MTKINKKILAAILLILFVLYWAAVNFLVSAVLVPSFMEGKSGEGSRALNMWKFCQRTGTG